MKKYNLKQSDTETYTSHAGLSLIGLCLNKYGNINKAFKHIPLRYGISHSDIIKSYMSTLSLGKSDFEAVENHRQDKHFKTSLSIDQVPFVIPHFKDFCLFAQ